MEDVKISVRLHREELEVLDEMKALMQKHSTSAVTRSDVLREAIACLYENMEAEIK